MEEANKPKQQPQQPTFDLITVRRLFRSFRQKNVQSIPWILLRMICYQLDASLGQSIISMFALMKMYRKTVKKKMPERSTLLFTKRMDAYANFLLSCFLASVWSFLHESNVSSSSFFAWKGFFFARIDSFLSLLCIAESFASSLPEVTFFVALMLMVSLWVLLENCAFTFFLVFSGQCSLDVSQFSFRTQSHKFSLYISTSNCFHLISSAFEIV